LNYGTAALLFISNMILKPILIYFELIV